MEMVKRNHYLIVFQNRVVCKPEDFCFRAMELLDYPEFVFLVILSELTVCYLQTGYLHITCAICLSRVQYPSGFACFLFAMDP